MGLIRGEIQQNEGLCVFVIFLIVKNEFLLSWFVIFTSYNKGDERKRNETRFDTITVSLKAIWLVLGSVSISYFCCLVQNSRVFLLRVKNACFFTLQSNRFF